MSTALSPKILGKCKSGSTLDGEHLCLVAGEQVAKLLFGFTGDT